MIFDVTLPQSALQGILRATGRVVTGHAPQPVLSGVLLAAEGGSLTATAYDLAMGVRAASEAVVGASGAIVAPHRMLASLVAALPEGSMVRLAAEDSMALRIEAGEGRYSVALSHEPEDYPALPTLDDIEPFGLPFGAIKRALTAVAYATATAESKQVLCGVEFKMAKGTLQLTAADGSRGSIYTLPDIAGADESWSFVLPNAAVKEVLKLVLADDDLLLVSRSTAFGLFDSGDTAIITNLAAGNYPPMSQLLPKSCKVSITCDRQAMISAVERASIVASIENGTLTFSYDAETGDFAVSAANEAGSAADLVATGPGSKGDGFTLHFNSRFALDALRHVETESVSIAFNDPRMAVFNPVGNALHRQMLAAVAVRAAAAPEG